MHQPAPREHTRNLNILKKKTKNKNPTILSLEHLMTLQ